MHILLMPNKSAILTGCSRSLSVNARKAQKVVSKEIKEATQKLSYNVFKTSTPVKLG